MLTIICGEDSVTSRTHYSNLKEEYRQKGVEIQQIAPRDIQEQINKSDMTMNLFASRIVFFTENLNSFLGRGKNKALEEQFTGLAQSKEIEIIDWEDGKGSRELKIAKFGTVKEFKASKNIFQLQDACYPKNREKFIALLDTLKESQDEIFIFTMLSRHIRTLIQIKSGAPTKLAPWQAGKLSSQAKQWDTDKLTGFYEGLSRIDSALKTSSSPYSVKESLDILACYYL